MSVSCVAQSPAFIFAFVTSFDNVVVSIYLIGADTVTLSIRILTSREWRFDPSIAAISTIFIVVTTALVAGAETLTGLNEKARRTVAENTRDRGLAAPVGKNALHYTRVLNRGVLGVKSPMDRL